MTHQSSRNDWRRRPSRVGSAVNHRSFRPVPPRKSSRRLKYRPSRRNGVPQRAPGRLYAVPRATAVAGGGWKMPVATGIACCRLGPVEEGDEASERIADQEHARRPRNAELSPSPLEKLRELRDDI